MAWRPFNHFALKVAALCLAVLLWITVSGQQVQRNVLVQLQFRNMPSSLDMTGDTPRLADVLARCRSVSRSSASTPRRSR